jgi:hypothetical protein
MSRKIKISPVNHGFRNQYTTGNLFVGKLDPAIVSSVSDRKVFGRDLITVKNTSAIPGAG